MSHCTTVEVQLKDVEILKQVLDRLGVAHKDNDRVEFFDGQIVSGFSFHLPNWRQPVVLSNNTVMFDNYEGHWGDLKYLNKVIQNYSIEVVKRSAIRQGYRCQERMLETGEVKLTLTVGE